MKTDDKIRQSAAVLRPGQRVTIGYPGNPRLREGRTAYVIEDKGGPKVKVSWTAQKQYVSGHGHRILREYPKTHEQWIPRERLEK